MDEVTATLAKRREQRWYQLTGAPPTVCAVDGAADEPFLPEYVGLFLVDDRVFLVNAEGPPPDGGLNRAGCIAQWKRPDLIPEWLRHLVAILGYEWAAPEVRHG